ncbi:MAG: hypothetical protein HND57_08605 [Planctomycetes bacterium]|nr:hypothetical protein [Planctomycetota bacterium]
MVKARIDKIAMLTLVALPLVLICIGVLTMQLRIQVAGIAIAGVAAVYGGYISQFLSLHRSIVAGKSPEAIYRESIMLACIPPVFSWAAALSAFGLPVCILLRTGRWEWGWGPVTSIVLLVPALITTPASVLVAILLRKAIRRHCAKHRLCWRCGYHVYPGIERCSECGEILPARNHNPV